MVTPRIRAASARERSFRLEALAEVLRAKGKRITCLEVGRLAGAMRELLRDRGRISKSIALELQRIEREYRFTVAARAEFQNLLGRLGIDSAFPIEIPPSSEPLWARYCHPLQQYRSNTELPAAADVVIIGAGLTGASAAYHLREAVAQGRRVVVLERGSPACEASGRNAGNFELLPENSVGTYGGFARERLRFLRRCYPGIPLEVLRVEADRQASLVLSFAIRNRERLKQIIAQENIPCDFSPKGWLYLAHTEGEEQAVCDEVALANRQDQQIEIWSRMKIRQEFGFDSDFIGRFVPGDGTYHPAKFVYGVLQVAVAAGVELYTGVSVQDVHEATDGSNVVETDSGLITARKVIVATNAFTRELFPELGAIAPAQSQIAVTEFAPDRCRGRVVTSEDGPVYFNQPRDGAADGLAPLLLGGGKDRAMRNASSRRRVPAVHKQLLKLRARFFPELRSRPFSTEWVGPIALTPDQIPAMGFLRPGVVIAAGFNGYGGSYCVAAGQAAAEMATTGAVPDWLPEDVFSPQRLLDGKPLFFGEIGSLWCYAACLCVQLRAVNRQLNEARQAVSLASRQAATGKSQSLKASQNGMPENEFAAEALQSVRLFRNFSRSECEELLRISKFRRVKRGEPLQDDGARSCLVILEGSVALADAVGGNKQRISEAQAGCVVGHLGLIDGGPDLGVYVAQQDSTILELKHTDCHALLACRSQLSQKFLGALAEAVIQELKRSERQLRMRNRQSQPKLPLVRVASAN